MSKINNKSSDSVLTKNVMSYDIDKEISKISDRLKHILRNDLHKRGLVVAMSGGIDSSACAALCVEAIGKDKVFGILLPEKDSSTFSTDRGTQLAEHLGIKYIKQDIADTLDAIGCYRWRDEAIRETFPEYNDDWKSKIVIAGGLQGKINYFNLVVQTPDGDIKEKKLALKQYLQIVAATNYKQRIRKSIEYFHADRLNYAVVGTPNRLEYDQGFFVKGGDGAADVKPISHLYKTQVYEIAQHLGLPDEICKAVPTTDTYSLAQGQDEFYFALPYKDMDIALWSYNHGVSCEDLANALNISNEQSKLIYNDIETKRRTTSYLHKAAVLIEDVDLGF